MNRQKPQKISNRQLAHTLSASHDDHCICPGSEHEGEPDITHGGTSECAFSASARKNMQRTEVMQNNCSEANHCHSTFTFTYGTDLLLIL